MTNGNDTIGGMDTLSGWHEGEAGTERGPVRDTLSGGETLGADGRIVLAGRYAVVKRLGEGGMGSVWLAEDRKLDGRKVAVKMLPSVLAGKKTAYRQVKQEALMAMKLSHPNTATVRAFEEDESGNPFLVMDFIDGEGLDEMLAEKGKLSEDETLALLGPVAAALDYAHSHGVVHRDVKPGNVMVAKDGTAYVLDFGIAREIQETMTRVTGKLSSGTLLYMSPEQLNGDKPRAAQDVYSFAAMAYECLTGKPPFARGQIEWQIVNKAPEPLPDGVGEALRNGVMAGLAKDPKDRPATCAGVLGLDEAEKREREKRAAEEARRLREEERARARQREAEEAQRQWKVEAARARAQAAYESRRREEALEAEREARKAAEAKMRKAQEEAARRAAEAMRAEEAKGRATAALWFFAVVLAVAGAVGWTWWQDQQAKNAAPNASTQTMSRQGKAPAGPAAPPAKPATAKPEPVRGAWDGAYAMDRKTVTLPDGKKMRLRWCPAGTFTMGSPSGEEGRYSDETQHQVTLTRGFWMAETEVTQGQWKSLMETTVADLARKGLQDDTGYDFNDGKGAITMRERWGMKKTDDPMNRCGDLDDDVPVYNVGWNEAKEFCRRLTAKGRNEGWLPEGYAFRLPTEAEWEYACRAGTTTALPNGKDIRIVGTNNAPALDDIAWYSGNSSVGYTGSGWDTEGWPEKQYPGGRACARKVGLKAANNWGLHDMIGNVWEWCEDECSGYPSGPVTDYVKRNTSTAPTLLRVLRGGSWLSYARFCRSACRDRMQACLRGYGVGFRPVCSAGSVQ